MDMVILAVVNLVGIASLGILCIYAEVERQRVAREVIFLRARLKSNGWSEFHATRSGGALPLASWQIKPLIERHVQQLSALRVPLALARIPVNEEEEAENRLYALQMAYRYAVIHEDYERAKREEQFLPTIRV